VSRYLLDVNILLDCYDAGRQTRFPDSLKVVNILQERAADIFISSSSLDNLHFIKWKSIKDENPHITAKAAHELANRFIVSILDYATVAKTPAYIELDYDDLEDSQIIASAKSVEAKVVTRDAGILNKHPDIAISSAVCLQEIQQNQIQKPIFFLGLKEINQFYSSKFDKVFDSVLNSGWPNSQATAMWPVFIWSPPCICFTWMNQARFLIRTNSISCWLVSASLSVKHIGSNKN
jgi:predicted nucleic acid-binding protein